MKSKFCFINVANKFAGKVEQGGAPDALTGAGDLGRYVYIRK